MLYISRIEYGSHSLDKSMKACIIAQKKLDKSKNIDDIKSFCEREFNKKNELEQRNALSIHSQN